MKSHRSILIFLSILFSACTEKKPAAPDTRVSDAINNELKDVILTDYNTFYIKRTTAKNRTHFSDTILNKKIYLWEKWNPVAYKDKIDWNANPYQDDSWQLYLQSLRMVSHLCNSYELTGDKKYLNHAIDQTFDWIVHHLPKPINKEEETKLENEAENNFIWYDHSVANRLITLTYLFELYKKTNDRDDLKVLTLAEAIYIHAEWLSKDENYAHGNHAIMEDRALLQFAIMYPYFDESKAWKTKALLRLEERISNDVSPIGVHLENSPGYHPFVMDLCIDIIDIHEQYELKAPTYLDSTLTKMEKYLAHVMMPNGRMPHIGDTQGNTPYPYKKYNNRYLDFIDRKAMDTLQMSNCFIDTLAGVAIIRDKWHQGEDFDKASWLFFNAGYKTKIHKHADHLSFMLYAQGEVLITDAGHYSYTPSDLQTYFHSSLAHNNVILNDESYRVGRRPINTSKMTNVEIHPNYYVLEGSHTGYEDARISRQLHFYPPNLIFILDKVETENTPNRIARNFNLPEKAKILEKNDQMIHATIGAVDLTISSLSHTLEHRYYYASETPIRAWASSKTLHKTPMHQFELSTKPQKSTNMLTSIYLENDHFENPVHYEFIKETEHAYHILVKSDLLSSEIKIMKNL